MALLGAEKAGHCQDTLSLCQQQALLCVSVPRQEEPRPLPSVLAPWDSAVSMTGPLAGPQLLLLHFSLCLSSSRQISEQLLGNMRWLLWWGTLHIPCQGAARPTYLVPEAPGTCLTRLPALCVCVTVNPEPPHLSLLGQNSPDGRKNAFPFPSKQRSHPRGIFNESLPRLVWWKIWEDP